MSKLNKRPKAARVAEHAAVKAQTPVGPLKTKQRPTTTTFEGAPAYQPKAKTELFTLAVTNMVGEKTFYELAQTRDERFVKLVHKVAVKDPEWTLGFVRFLRGTANMRTASIVAAAEAVKARLNAGDTAPVRKGAYTAKPSDLTQVDRERIGGVTNRQIIDAALQRADEPGELLAYWMNTHGRNVPKPVKRGLADAATRLYSEYSLLKYDTASHGVRFGDVLDLTHPTPGALWQGALFAHALDRRHNRAEEPSASGPLPMVARQAEWRRNAQLPKIDNKLAGQLIDADILKGAGLTWEDVLSALGSKIDKRKLWEAMIPNMGIMALIRNLRNFDEAGVSDRAAQQVIARLVDPAQIAKSRQLPFRFYTAYQAAPSDRWKHALGVALDLACANVPQLPGRTLVLIDTSGSMTWNRISEKSQVTPAQAAAVLGFVLAKRNGAEVWQWATTRRHYHMTKGRSALQEIDTFLGDQDKCGGGTDLAQALQAYDGQDRVVILSDEQTVGVRDYASNDRHGIDRAIPAHVPVYAWDLQGYGKTPIASSGTRHQLAGFSDAAFKLMPLLEAVGDGSAPDWGTLFGTEA